MKKTEEMRRFSEQGLEKLEREIVKGVDLAPESRKRLNVEITGTKNEIQQKYTELKTRISKAIVPE